MLASLLAAALWERDQPDEAGALLANRLDVLERSGLPEAVLLGYRTMARIAAAEGAEHRALELLGALHAVGVARRLPRLRIASLVDQVRLHARRFRPETCRDLCAQIDALLADPEAAAGPAVAAQRRCCCASWRSATPRSRRRTGAARSRPLARADARGAGSVRQGRLHIELLGLRAWVLDRCGEKSLGLLREAADLARHLRPAARLRRCPPGARRLGAPGAVRRGAAAGRARAAGRADARAAGRGAAPAGRAPRRAWRSRPRSARCWSCWRATSPTRRSGWRCRWAKRPSSGT